MGHRLRQNWNTFNNAMNQLVVGIFDQFFPEEDQHQQAAPPGQQEAEEQQVAGADQEEQQMAEMGQNDLDLQDQNEAAMEDLEDGDADQDLMQEEIPAAAQEQLDQQEEMEDQETEPPIHLWLQGNHPLLPACSLCPREQGEDPCKRVRRVVFE